MTILRVIKNSENKLMRGRIVDGEDLNPPFQVRSLAKGSKWADADIKEYRVTRARTILCKTVNHSLECKKNFQGWQAIPDRKWPRGRWRCWRHLRRGRRFMDAVPRGSWFLNRIGYF